MKGKIFNAQEVQAILNGSKVMFREVVKPYPILSDDKSYWEFKGVRWAGEKSSYAKKFGDNAKPEMPDLCPYQVGQKIFCKETFSDERFGESLIYKCADVRKEKVSHWRTASNMKQEHSRLTPLIKEIRVERLAEISEEDAIAEGVMNHLRIVHYNPVEYFRQLWNATHKKPEEKFETSPFCWVVSFEVINN